MHSQSSREGRQAFLEEFNMICGKARRLLGAPSHCTEKLSSMQNGKRQIVLVLLLYEPFTIWRKISVGSSHSNTGSPVIHEDNEGFVFREELFSLLKSFSGNFVLVEITPMLPFPYVSAHLWM